MDVERLSKQVNWLDDERRKDQTRLSSLEERMTALENMLQANAKDLKNITGEIQRMSALFSAIENVEEDMRQMRIEVNRIPEMIDKAMVAKEEELTQSRQKELRNLEKELTKVRKELEQVAELKRSLQARVEEEGRLNRELDEVLNQVETTRRSQEEFTRTVRVLEDGRRQDAKRLTDTIGEVSALRKRVDEHRGRLDLASTEIKKLENRVTELVNADIERRESLRTFLENQALKDVERERIWNEWQNHFATIETQAAELESTFQKLESTHKTVKQSHKELQELSEKVERRIAELIEMQRLSEERLRQEWISFKAEDQKRWANYTLTSDEQYNEFLRKHERLADTVTNIQDDLHDMQDILTLANEQTEKRLQNLLAMTHEWVSNFERLIGRVR